MWGLHNAAGCSMEQIVGRRYYTILKKHQGFLKVEPCSLSSEERTAKSAKGAKLNGFSLGSLRA
jgi:hypothetical protein